MPSFRVERPMCKRPEELEPEDSIIAMLPDGTGGVVRTTCYKDGTTTVHWGGPCGDSHYDENGEEC